MACTIVLLLCALSCPASITFLYDGVAECSIVAVLCFRASKFMSFHLRHCWTDALAEIMYPLCTFLSLTDSSILFFHCFFVYVEFGFFFCNHWVNFFYLFLCHCSKDTLSEILYPLFSFLSLTFWSILLSFHLFLLRLHCLSLVLPPHILHWVKFHVSPLSLRSCSLNSLSQHLLSLAFSLFHCCLCWIV